MALGGNDGTIERKENCVGQKTLMIPTVLFLLYQWTGPISRCGRKSTPIFSIDNGQYSHKFNHGGLKYEIAIDVF
jgi:hypothetical protein